MTKAKQPQAIWKHQYEIKPDANLYGFDIETFNDFWCIAFHYYQSQTNPDGTTDFIKTIDPTHPQAKSEWMFRSDDRDDGGIEALKTFINDQKRQKNHVFVAWNVTYDLKMLENLLQLAKEHQAAALPALLKRMSDHFIANHNPKSRLGANERLDAIDLGWYSEVVPIVTYDAADIYLKKRDAQGNSLPATSLKEAAANNGSSIIESEVPFDQIQTSAQERDEIVKYNHNDVHVMMEIFQRVAKTPYLLKLDFVKALEQKHRSEHPETAWKPLNAILLRQSEQGLVKKMLNWTQKPKTLAMIDPFFLYEGHPVLTDVIKSHYVNNHPWIVAAYKQAINHVFIDKQYLKNHPVYQIPHYLVYLLNDQNLMHIQKKLNDLIKPLVQNHNFDHQFSTIRKQIKTLVATKNNDLKTAANDLQVHQCFKDLTNLLDQSRKHLALTSIAAKTCFLYYRAFSYVYQPYQHFEMTNDDFYGMVLQVKEGGIHASKDGLEVNQESWSADVASYYPNEIINRKLLNETLLDRYQAILDKRLELKKQQDPVEKIYKLVINKVYGYTGDGASSFYDNKASFSICLNGQFQLLVLAHLLNESQIVKQWIQMNTDGIQFVPVDTSDQSIAIYEQVLKQWEEWFNFKLETTKFKYFMNFNVSTYIGITNENKIKNKGKIYKDVQMDINAPGYTFADLVFQQNILAHLLHNLFVKKQPFMSTFKENPQLWKYQNVAKFGNTYQQIFVQHNLEQSQLNLSEQGFDLTKIANDLKHYHLDHHLPYLNNLKTTVYQSSSIKNHALRGFYSQSGYYMKKFKPEHLVAKQSNLIKNANKQVGAPTCVQPWATSIQINPVATIKHFHNLNQKVDFKTNQNAYQNFQTLMYQYFGLNWFNDLKIKTDDVNTIVDLASKQLLKVVQKDLKAAKILSTTSFIDQQNGHKWIALKTGLNVQNEQQASVINRYFIDFDDPSSTLRQHPIYLQYHVHDSQSQNNYYLTINTCKPEQEPKYEQIWNGENIGGISDFPCVLYLDQIHHLNVNDLDFQIDYQAYSILALYALLGLDGFRFDQWLVDHHHSLGLDFNLVNRYANGEYHLLYEIVPAIFGFQPSANFELKETIPKAIKGLKKTKTELAESAVNEELTYDLVTNFKGAII